MCDAPNLFGRHTLEPGHYPLGTPSKPERIVCGEGRNERACGFRCNVAETVIRRNALYKPPAHHQDQAFFDQATPDKKFSRPERQRRMQTLGSVSVSRMNNKVVHLDKALQIERVWERGHEYGQRTDARFERAVERVRARRTTHL